MSELINTRLDSVFESIMHRATETMMRIIRPEARRIHSELEELRIEHATLQGELQRVREQLARTARIARRLDRAGRAMGMYEFDDNDGNPNVDHADSYFYPARSDASNWQWPR